MKKDDDKKSEEEGSPVPLSGREKQNPDDPDDEAEAFEDPK